MSSPAPDATCYTALLAVSGTEAYLARSTQRNPTGPNGEWHLAQVLHTTDAGQYWHVLSWHRGWRSRWRYPDYPNWPPEFVLGIRRDAGALIIMHRDEWVIFEPGGESLWETTFDGVSWRPRRLRMMDYEGGDSARPIPGIALSLLPLSIQPPAPD